MKIQQIFEPKTKLEDSRKFFSNRDLFNLIYPLLIEQTLMLLVGIVDTLMVSYAGESAVSGVSLINQVNAVFISVYVALASGGSVVISQYLGRKDYENGNLCCSQLVSMAFSFSLLLSILMLLVHQPLLNFLYGSVTVDVMEACRTYLIITTLSFPALAVYNACSAILRSLALTKITMVVSIIMNVINVIGNAIGIFVFHAGVAGVAIPSLISRVVAALLMLYVCSRKDHTLYLHFRDLFSFHRKLSGQIVHIALPNAMENGLLDGLKVVLSSIVALFGTMQIAANGVAQTFWSLAALFSIVMGPVFIIVVGRALGARDMKAADYYINKLLRITFVGAFLWNLITFLLIPLALQLYKLSPETISLIILLCAMHNLANFLVQPFGFVLANVLRAAGDVRYALMTSITASLSRVALAYLFGVIFGMGVIGVTLAMICDWVIRAVLILIRYKSGKWREFKVI